MKLGTSSPIQKAGHEHEEGANHSIAECWCEGKLVAYTRIPRGKENLRAFSVTLCATLHLNEEELRGSELYHRLEDYERNFAVERSTLNEEQATNAALSLGRRGGFRRIYQSPNGGEESLSRRSKNCLLPTRRAGNQIPC